MINKKRLIQLTQDLIKINSENPPGDERQLAAFVVRYMKQIGLKPKLYTFFPQRDNVLVILPAKARQSRQASKSLLITPHLDTVPAGKGWHGAPFSGQRRAGRIYGRGATDCKGNLAVAMEVFNSLAEEKFPLNNDVIFLATADEETGSAKGLIPLLNRNLLRPSAAVVLDSDEFNIITVQKGLIHFKVSVQGRKAHGAYPERGTNAIDKACQLIGILKKTRFSFKSHKLLRPPTINIGTIHGGDKVNMVADWCAFEADLRFLPGMEAKKILAHLKSVFDKTKISYNIQVQDIQQPYEISSRHPLVEAFQKAARGVVRESKVKGSEGATVITFFKKKNIPAIATGYGVSGCAHATDEYITTSNLYRGALVLERFIKIFDKR